MTCFYERDYYLGEFLVLPNQNTLVHQDNTIKLEPKVMAVLCYLSNNHKQVVSVDNIIQHVWQGNVVSNQSAQRCISILRKVLKTSIDEKPYIVNFSKKGYQLQHTPVERGTESKVEQKPSTTIPSSDYKSIKVLGRKWALWGGAITLIFLFVFLFTTGENKSPLDVSIKTITPFTFAAGYEYYAEPHPDGTQIAHIQKKNEVYQLVVTRGGGEPWILTTSRKPIASLNWSEDGTNLLALIYQNNQSTFIRFQGDFKTKNVQQQTIEITQPNITIYSVTWLNNDELIIAASIHQQTQRLYKYNLTDYQIIEVENTQEAYLARHFEKKTVRVLHDKEDSVIEVVDTKNNVVNTWHVHGKIDDISWQSNTDNLLMLKRNELYILTFNEPPKQIYYATENTLYRPRFSSDGTKIYVTQELQNIDTLQVKLDGSVSPLLNSTYRDMSAKYSKDGKSIAFVSNRSGSDQVWLKQQNREIQLTYFNDNRRILAINWLNEQNQLLLNFDNGSSLFSLFDRTEKMVNSNLLRKPMAFDTKNNEMTFLNGDELGMNVWKTNIDTNQAKQISFTNVTWTHVQDKHIYYQESGKDGVIHYSDDVTSAILPTVPAYTVFYSFEETGLYYLDISQQDDPAWHYIDFTTEHDTYLFAHPNEDRWITDFHPKQGALFSRMMSKEKNIVTLEID